MRKPANDKWVKAERKPLPTTQDTQKAWERRGRGTEEGWTWPATPVVTALEPRALGTQTEQKTGNSNSERCPFLALPSASRDAQRAGQGTEAR